jgi:YD repeat-containing protein
MLARCNGELLAASIPGIRHEFRVNLVDFRLSSPKVWRDVYHYSADGRPTGWTRYDGAAATEFNARGQMIESRDAQGRCLTARSVIYDRKRPAGYDPRSGPDRSPLTFSPGFHAFRYEYESERDRVGKMIESADSK